MGFQFCDSFDCYDVTASIAKKWSSVGADFALSTTGGRFGGGCFQNSGGGSYAAFLTRNVSIVSGATTYVAMWIQITGVTSAGIQQPVIAFNGGSTNNGPLCLTAAGNLALIDWNGGVTLATSTANISDGAYHWIEFALKINGSSTVAALYIDGVLQFSGTYSMTQTAQVITSVYIGPGYNFNSGPNSIDDVIIWDDQGSTFNTFPLGPRRIACLNPSGAGSSTGFTPSTGTNWSCAAQAYAGTKTLISTTSGQVDTYVTAGLSYSPSSVINGVVVNSYAQNPAADGTKNLISKLQSTTIASGATHVPTGTLITYQDCFTTDSTGAAWNTLKVDGMQPGIGD